LHVSKHTQTVASDGLDRFRSLMSNHKLGKPVPSRQAHLLWAALLMKLRHCHHLSMLNEN